MKKIIIGLLGFILLVTTAVILKFSIFTEAKDEIYVSAAALYGSNQPIDIPTETGEKGTETNPFVILEIVPYEGYAEIGYMIQGCEPIPMDRLAFDKDAGTLVTSTNGMTVQWKEETTFDIPSTDIIGNKPGNWQEKETAIQFGYFKKVTTGEGDFSVILDEASKVTSFTSEQGDYVWVAAVENTEGALPVDYQEDQAYYAFARSRMLYSRERNYFTYSNDFAKISLLLKEEQIPNYKITVITITPDNLNLAINQPLIDRADLISISPRSHYNNGKLVDLWETYHPSMVKASKKIDDFIENDLTWETTAEILRKASVDEDDAPILFDKTVFTDNKVALSKISPMKEYGDGSEVKSNSISSEGYLNNIAKLYLVMQQMEPAKFYLEYIATGLIKSVPMKISSTDYLYNGTVKMTTGYYIAQDSSYSSSTVFNKYKTHKAGSKDYENNPAAIWSIHTFLPFEMLEDSDELDDSFWKTIGIDNYEVEVNSSSKVYVRHNLFSYDGNNNFARALTEDLTTYNIDYQHDVEYCIEAFQYFSKTSGSITPAMAIDYLLHQNRPVYSQDSIRILEIEPSYDFIWTGTSDEWSIGSGTNGTLYARQFFTKFFPNFKGKISITTMTSSEFIGNIDDLNATYDMIFFGLKDGLLRKNSSGYTVYNDSSMYKKIYTHKGDKITQNNNNLAGLPGKNNPSNTYRFSGNDITLLKVTALSNFLQAGKPIILDKGFYKNSNKTAINDTLIDEYSNVYKLAKLTNANLFYADGISTNQLEAALSMSNCKIVFGNTKKDISLESCYPTVYRDRTVDIYKDYSDAQIYINGNNTSYRTLQYKFYIRDDVNSDANYTVKLYIDINADGKYDDATENVTGLIVQDEYGYVQDYTSLEPMVNYTVTRTLEADYFGVLPWKLEIVSNNSTDNEARDSIINYAALKTTKRIQLNVLQIMSNTGNNVRLDDNPFKDLITPLTDYEIKITTKYLSEVDVWCKTDPSNYDYILSDDNDDFGVTDNDGIDDDHDGVYDFDMLVIGFADCYSDIKNLNTLKNINEFIEEGKTVLFTHDTTSFYNDASIGGSSNWGYNMNQYFRNLFGMDRFGVTLPVDQRKAAGKDYASDPTDYSNNGYIQGYTNMILDRYAVTSGQYSSNKNVALSSNIFNDYMLTTKVTRANQGQLTEYPYRIDSRFTIAKTHGQYYQLDLENDDIVVWYCLSDDKNTNGVNNGYYSSNPNDVRNNYYIYNIGNITYSGVGHSSVSGQMEAKLFVNTMIAAYTATAKAAEVIITNKNTSKGNNADYVYVDYDIYNTSLAYGSEVQSLLTDQSQRIKFRINDNNILFNKVITLSYYAVNMVGSVEVETELTELKTKRVKFINNPDKDIPVAVVYSGTEYYIDIPLSMLQSNKMIINNNFGTKIRIQVLVTYGRDKSKTKITKHDFILTRRGLFDLD